jgi:hypothetical protein
MWQTITNCGKQLSVQSKLRENDDGHYKVYTIIEIEFDQYKLELISRDEHPAEQKLHQVLNCEQLIRYRFQVDVE